MITMVGESGASSSANCADLLRDMSSSELTMIHRLSGNDPVVRKKTVRKLSKWLMALAGKVSDNPESRNIIEPNFIRVWKALFYCMWMSDKPLAQEQLAEQISDLVNIFAPKPHLMCLFIEWFILTMSREWPWIDRFRMDKYMMLVRRFLRKVLLVFSDGGWNTQSLSTFSSVITNSVLNRESPPTKKSKGKDRSLVVKAPLGFQIHFIDIFMEELAKIGGDHLKKQKVLKIITPFIKELSLSDDDRMIDELRERIFHQLMKQSDVAQDFHESRGGKYVFIEDENANEDVVDPDETMEDEDSYESPLDPRAGAVDVLLPQLQIDYSELANKLIEFGGQKGVKMKNRKLMYNLARQFKEITEGKYPLAVYKEDTRKPAIPRKELKKATDRLLELEISDSVAKRRKTKKERKREALRSGSTNSNDSVGSEDNSAFLHDDELLDHVSDNYMSYLEDEIHNKAGSEEEVDGTGVKGVQSSEKKGKGKKLKKDKEKVNVEDLEGMNVEDLEGMNVDINNSNVDNNALNNGNTEEETIYIKRRKTRSSEPSTNRDVLRTIKKTTAMKAKKEGGKKSRKILATQNAKLFESLNDSMQVQLSSTPRPKITSSPVGSMKRKMRSPRNLLTPQGQSPNSAKKKVCFILAKNMEHEHADYKQSIQRSPAIPFSAAKRPSFGLLKSPRSTPTNSSPRRKAAEFF